MGADLVGWMAKGPLKLRISRKHKRQIILRLTQIANWWIGMGEDAESDYSSHIGECPIPIDKSLVEDDVHLYRLMDWLTAPDDEAAGDKPPRELITERLDELLCWPPADRGTVSIRDPDDPQQVIVFSGEMTWGDEPDLDGYRQLQMLALTGVGAVVGIKLIPAFVTLSLTDP